MDVSKLELPVPHHRTFNKVDASKLKEFITCPRKYFYRNVLGWDRESLNIHLEFGSAWHEAMEHLKIYGYEEDSVNGAFAKFLKYYRKAFDEVTDRDNAPKNPGYAEIALKEYAAIMRRRPKRELIATEIGCTVPISGRHSISGRLDAIERDKILGIVGSDYKTGSRFTTVWYDQWKLSIQMQIYNHMLKTAFLDEKVYGMIVVGTILYKTKQRDLTTHHRHVDVPVRLSDKMMNAWLFDINHWFDMLEWNFKQLSLSTPDEPVMQAFPKNTESCTKYNKMCQFHDLCTAWPNPLKKSETPPGGFSVSFWDHEAEPVKFELTEGNLKQVKEK